MAIGKKTGGLILVWAMAAAAAQFPVKYRQWRRGSEGTLEVGEAGVRFAGAKGQAWQWGYDDIRQLELAPDRIVLTSYETGRLPGTERSYEFDGVVPAAELYALLKNCMDQRLVAEMALAGGSRWSLPVKQGGSEGVLEVADDAITYRTAAKDESRTWRYTDVAGISSAGPFQLTITTYELAPARYGGRRDFQFEMRQPITEARYNQLWLDIERKSGRIP